MAMEFEPDGQPVHGSQRSPLSRFGEAISMQGRRALAAVAACAASLTTAAEFPCESRAESRQFDFWLGEWTVMSEGKPVATSRIEKAASGCVILESYTQDDGFSGTSINFFDPLLGKWRQTWADSAGNASEFSGTYRDRAMRFEGESHRGTQRILRHMTLSDLGNGQVRQQSELSRDDGKTWVAHYELRYVRRN
jgi:hypothetical protein